MCREQYVRPSLAERLTRTLEHLDFGSFDIDFYQTGFPFGSRDFIDGRHAPVEAIVGLAELILRGRGTYEKTCAARSIRHRARNDTRVRDPIQSQVLMEVLEISWKRLECHHATHVARELRCEQTVESDKRSHVIHHHSGPEDGT